MESRDPKRKGKYNWRAGERKQGMNHWRLNVPELNKHGWTQTEGAPRLASSRNKEKIHKDREEEQGEREVT